MPKKPITLNSFLKNGELITDYCEILGINPDFTEKDLEKAYKERCLVCHPDKNQDSDLSTAIFQILKDAYDKLKDPYERHKYLESLETGSPSPETPTYAAGSASSAPTPSSEELLEAQIANFINLHLPKIGKNNPIHDPKLKAGITIAYRNALSNPDSVNKSVTLIKSYIFIKNNLHYSDDISFLEKYPLLVKEITDAYDNNSYHDETLNLIKSLIFINKHVPDIQNVLPVLEYVSFLKNNPLIAKEITDAYDNNLYHDETLNLIKSLIFIYKNLPEFQNVLPDGQYAPFLKKRLLTTKNIAATYNENLLDPAKNSDFVKKALALIMAHLKLEQTNTHGRRMSPSLPPVLPVPTSRMSPSLPPVLPVLPVPTRRVQNPFKNPNFANTPSELNAESPTTRPTVSIPEAELGSSGESLGSEKSTPSQPIDQIEYNKYMRYLTESESYLHYLQKKPKNPLVNSKIQVMEQAVDILKYHPILNNPNTRFIEHIKTNMPVLIKRMDPRLKEFLKGLGVAAASIFGIGIGGILAYKRLYKEHRTDKFLADIGIKQSPTKKVSISAAKNKIPVTVAVAANPMHHNTTTDLRKQLREEKAPNADPKKQSRFINPLHPPQK